MSLGSRWGGGGAQMRSGDEEVQEVLNIIWGPGPPKNSDATPGGRAPPPRPDLVTLALFMLVNV